MVNDFKFLGDVIKHVKKEQQHFLHTFEMFQDGEEGIILEVTFSDKKVKYCYYWADGPADKESPYVGEITLKKFLKWYE